MWLAIFDGAHISLRVCGLGACVRPLWAYLDEFPHPSALLRPWDTSYLGIVRARPGLP